MCWWLLENEQQQQNKQTQNPETVSLGCYPASEQNKLNSVQMQMRNMGSVLGANVTSSILESEFGTGLSTSGFAFFLWISTLY